MLDNFQFREEQKMVKYNFLRLFIPPKNMLVRIFIPLFGAIACSSYVKLMGLPVSDDTLLLLALDFMILYNLVIDKI